MTTTVRPSIETGNTSQIRQKRITVFHCANALDSSIFEQSDAVFRVVHMPCSSMTREIHLLKAFEDGADAVLVLVCPEGSCRYIEGNIRAKKRVTKVKKLLDDIGLNGDRLNIYNVPPHNENAIRDIIERTATELDTLGPNPAA